MIYIGSDHGGFQMKKHLLAFIKKELEQKIEDLGAFEYNEEDDYVDYAIKVAEKVVKGKDNFGILICKRAHGVNITANKIQGARASIGYSVEGVEWGRKDDDINILCLASKIITNEHASAIVKKFLETEFRTDNPKYARRLQKIAELEK